jgi:Protein of unknown function (DUF4240)
VEWERFWALIDLLDGSLDEAPIRRLVDALAKLPSADIEAFDDRLHEAVHALDGPDWFAQPVTDPALTELDLATLVAEVLAGGGDDALAVDGFLFARAAVVAAGRETYQQVLAHPIQFAGERDSRAEALLFVAQRAYEQANDDYYEHVPPVDVVTGSNTALWARPPLDYPS